MQIASVRRAASTACALLERTKKTPIDKWPVGTWTNHCQPVEALVRELNSALHEGTVGAFPGFWQAVLDEVLRKIPDDPFVFRRLAGQRTLYGKVTYLTTEVRTFLHRPLVDTHNRFHVVHEFCKALKTVNHPRHA